MSDCQHNAVCDEKFKNITEKLGEIHTSIIDLDKTVRNGITDKLSRHDTHITIQWWFIGGGIVAVVGLAWAVIGKITHGG